MAGEDAGPEALERLVAAAIHEIDMEEHTGRAPADRGRRRHPVRAARRHHACDDCVELARAFGERIATRFDLPVYLYADAAPASGPGQARRRPRGQYEGLKAEIGQHGREPDFGPRADAPLGGGRRPSGRGPS